MTKIITEGDQYRECTKCHEQGKRWASEYDIKSDGRDEHYVSYSGPYWCSLCNESFCDECGSHNLKAYDDGEGYPPNILCKNCGHWPQ
jgi:hypothetical protein